MNKWRLLTSQETEILKPYYIVKNKIISIILFITQITGILTSIVIIKDMFEYDNKPLFIITLIILYSIFVILPEILKHTNKRMLCSLNRGYAAICSAYAVNKVSKTRYTSDDFRNGTTTTYSIKVTLDLDNQKRSCNIHTDALSYSKIHIGDVCNIIYFPKKANEKMYTKHMVIFDTNFTVAKSYCEMYSKFKK